MLLFWRWVGQSSGCVDKMNSAVCWRKRHCSRFMMVNASQLLCDSVSASFGHDSQTYLSWMLQLGAKLSATPTVKLIAPFHDVEYVTRRTSSTVFKVIGTIRPIVQPNNSVSASSTTPYPANINPFLECFIETTAARSRVTTFEAFQSNAAVFMQFRWAALVFIVHALYFNCKKTSFKSN